MNELDLLRRAKYYMDRMSMGENPLTDEKFNPESEITGESFTRCFSYISGVLAEEIERRTECSRYVYKPNRKEFFLSPEEMQIVQISADSVGINTVAARINDVIDQNSMKGVSGGKLAECLVKMGYLRVEEMPGGGKVRIATELGAVSGITTIDKTDSVGKAYRQNVYSTEMQRFLIENINDIMAHAKSDSQPCHDTYGEYICRQNGDGADESADGELADDDFYGAFV